MQLRHRRGTILWHHVIDSNSDLLGTFSRLVVWLGRENGAASPRSSRCWSSVAAGVAKYLPSVFSWFFMRSWRSSMSFCMMFLGTCGVLGLGIFEGSSTWKAWKDESGREAKKAVKFTALLDAVVDLLSPLPWGFTLVLCLKVGPWNSNSFSWNQSNFQTKMIQHAQI